MKIRIYRKATPDAPESYDLDQLEFAQLARDFESFIKIGSPRQGIYRYNVGNEASAIRQTKDLLLRFDEVSVIG